MAGVETAEDPTLDQMELGVEGDLDAELGGQGENEGDDELLTIKDHSTRERDRYRVEGEPDYFNFATVSGLLKDNALTHTLNDFYLAGFEPIPMFGRSQRHLERVHAEYEVRSGFDKATHSFPKFVEEHRPLHAHSEGGKGIAMYPRGVVYLTADMSTINNVNITFGCPSNCSFCKESILARGYTQIAVDEPTGIIRVSVDGEAPFEVPSKSKVKFYDTENEVMVLGPLSVAVMREFPIATDSLDKLRRRELTRLLSD